MQTYQLYPIGKIQHTDQGAFIQLESPFIPGLQGLEGFSHLNVLWWFSDFDSEPARETLEMPQPYKQAPQVMGVFATRGPVRPNPIALTVAGVTAIDHQKGRVVLSWIDAKEGTPVLDLKPYTPSADRVEHPGVPQWCGHWPKSLEASEGFDWEQEFNF